MLSSSSSHNVRTNKRVTHASNCERHDSFSNTIQTYCVRDVDDSRQSTETNANTEHVSSHLTLNDEFCRTVVRGGTRKDSGDQDSFLVFSAPW
jgi:hypothetical protein